MNGAGPARPSLIPEWLNEGISAFGVNTPPRPMPRLEGHWVFITPDLASYWLDKFNTDNRPIKQHRVDRYVEMMTDGTWYDGTPQFIVFDDEHVLADGQQRLSAISKSTRGQWMMVAWGVTRRARKNIDTHSRRSAADNLCLSGARELFEGTNPSTVQAIARAYLQGGHTAKVELEAEQLERTLLQYPEGFAFALGLWRELPSKRVGLNRAMVGALAARAFYHIPESHRDRLRSFFVMLMTGEIANPETDQAVLPFRDYLTTHIRRMNTNANAEIYLRGAGALQAFLRGERRKINRPITYDPFPLPNRDADQAEVSHVNRGQDYLSMAPIGRGVGAAH
jgi:hypothetical protein